MAALSWTVFGLLALLWTAGAWLTAEAVDWIAQSLASGTAVQVARDMTIGTVPQWLQLWIDPAWLQALQSALRWLLELAGTGSPAAGAVAGWLIPLVWVGWGLGIVALLAAAAAVHLLLRRFSRRRAPA